MAGFETIFHGRFWVITEGMSALESTAGRVLAPLILGKAGSIVEEDTAGIAAWIHKTALIGMLVSSEDDRRRGYGVPATEYQALFVARPAPPPATQFWIGRYEGSRRLGAIWTTPLIVRVDGIREPPLPQAYLMTVILGEVILQGIRFTAPGMFFDVRPAGDFQSLWPGISTVRWPPAGVIRDDEFEESVSKGRHLLATLPSVALRPWGPAIDLPRSDLVGSMVRVHAPCGRHDLFYPAALVDAALGGVFHVFTRACDCGKSYLVQTEADGAHFKAEGPAPAIQAIYNEIEGPALVLEDTDGLFVCKRGVIRRS